VSRTSAAGCRECDGNAVDVLPGNLAGLQRVRQILGALLGERLLDVETGAE